MGAPGATRQRRLPRRRRRLAAQPLVAEDGKAPLAESVARPRRILAPLARLRRAAPLDGGRRPCLTSCFIDRVATPIGDSFWSPTRAHTVCTRIPRQAGTLAQGFPAPLRQCGFHGKAEPFRPRHEIETLLRRQPRRARRDRNRRAGHRFPARLLEKPAPKSPPAPRPLMARSPRNWASPPPCAPLALRMAQTDSRCRALSSRRRQ